MKLKSPEERKAELVGRMIVEGVTGVSDKEIEHAFRNCVCADYCIATAKQLVAEGKLTAADLIPGKG